jgi:glycosyltransferase involved in cell wall biosynthesis
MELAIPPEYQARSSSPLPVSVVVMTYNEEANIGLCLESVAKWADEIFVVDSFSTDRTEEIARNFPIQFVQHAYTSHPEQWDWALKTLAFRNEWILALDADFRVSPELKTALAQRLAEIPAQVTGLYVRHRQVFRGRLMKHGTIYPRYWLRLFRRGAVRVDQEDLVDLHFYVRGETARIEFDIAEDNLKERDLAFWISKQLRFAERAAIEEIRRRQAGAVLPMQPSLFGSPDQRTLWLKELWYRLPLYWRGVAYFVYRYVVRLGFLDGKEGFLYHFTQALLYRIVVDSYIDEFSKGGLTPEQLTDRLKPIGRILATGGERQEKMS